MVALFSFATVAGAAIVYFLPFVVAFARRRPGWPGLLLLNIAIGWTVIGWLTVLVWAASDPPPPKLRPAARRMDWRTYLRDFGRAKIETPVFEAARAAPVVGVPADPPDTRYWGDEAREPEDNYAEWLVTKTGSERAPTR